MLAHRAEILKRPFRVLFAEVDVDRFGVAGLD